MYSTGSFFLQIIFLNYAENIEEEINIKGIIINIINIEEFGN